MGRRQIWSWRVTQNHIPNEWQELTCENFFGSGIPFSPQKPISLPHSTLLVLPLIPPEPHPLFFSEVSQFSKHVRV